MDKFDRERFAEAYRALAEVFARERTPDSAEGHVPFILGDLTRRIFVGSKFAPPDEVFEATVDTIRTGDEAQRKALATRLRQHADHLDELTHLEDEQAT